MEKSDADRSCSSDEGSQLSRNRSFKSKQLVRSQALRESQSPPRTVSPSAIITDNIYDTIAKNVTLTKNNNSVAKTNTTVAKTNDNAVRNNSTVAKTNTTVAKTNDNFRNNVKVSVTVEDKTADNKINVLNVNDKIAIVKSTQDIRGVTDGSSQASDDRNSLNNISVSSDDKKKQQVEIQITPGGWDEQPSEQRLRTRRWLGHKHHSSSLHLLSNNPRVACVCGACGTCPHCRGRRRRPRCPTKQDSGIVCSDDCPDCSDTDHPGSILELSRKTSSLDEDQTHYCRCPERKEKPKSISRTDSDDKSEPTGADLVNFIKETLNKNGRDRMTLLRIEKELHSLINDTGRCIVRFPVMSSYGRMLVHRCASLFQLSHHLDTNLKNAVLVSKSGTSGGRIPCTGFRQWCTVTFPPSPQRRTPDHVNAKSILKRDTSLDEPGANPTNAVRSKSLEQREKDYERVRKKIFNSETGSCDEADWLTGPVKVLTAEAGRNKLLKVHSLETNTGANWSGSQQWDKHGAVAKSHSFGGYGQPDPPRLLSKQGDLASSSWRLSPSSSGYRTLSLHSADSVTPSPTDGPSPEPASSQGAVVWAVTDISAVPIGAVVIHPQTGRPLSNPDGSVYHFDPNSPPVLYDSSYTTSQPHKTEQKIDKRRGRLEKQHSFIDTECECQPSEEIRTKCCCDCRVKNKTHSETKPTKKPSSPCKNRYENNTPTNQNPSPNLSTNHRQPYDISTNQKELETKYEPHTYSSQEPSVSLKQFETTNQKPERFNSTNHGQDRQFESNQRQGRFETTNQKQERFETTNQRHEFNHNSSYDQFEVQKYERANQNASFESTNQKSNKLTNQESQDYGTHYYTQNYPQSYRQDEMTSPPQIQAVQYMQPDLSVVQNVHAKMTPLPVATPDPNIRPMSLTNVVYPTNVAQHYPYPMRMDQPLQHMYNSIQAMEEPKVTPASEHTFTIDPSYPYAPVDYSQCGACTTCVDPNLHSQRSYTTMPYQAESQPQLTYPVTNVMIPHANHIQPYPYQEQLQWPVQLPIQQMGQIPLPVPIQNPAGPKLMEMYPMVQCPTVMPHYVYPQAQMLTQPYQLCQPMYPMVENQRRSSISSQRTKRNSNSGSSRTTPLQTPPEDKKTHEEPALVPVSQTNYQNPRDNVTPTRENTATFNRNVQRQDSNDIAVKIQQIKDQMAQLNTGNRTSSSGTTYPTAGKPEWKRRNSGNGILGSYPSSGYNGRVLQTAPDNTQLSTAARAIVNSICSMQGKGNNQNQDHQQNNQYYQHNQSPHYQHNNVNQIQNSNHYQHNNANRRRQEDTNRISLEDRSEQRRPQPAVPFQYRPPYLLRQISPGGLYRRSPGPIHPVLNQPRRPNPDSRHPRR